MCILIIGIKLSEKSHFPNPKLHFPVRIIDRNITKEIKPSS